MGSASSTVGLPAASELPKPIAFQPVSARQGILGAIAAGQSITL